MNWKKINIIEAKNKKTKACLVVVFLILIFLFLFSVINLITVIELRNQVELILSDISETKIKNNSATPISTSTSFLPSSDNSIASSSDISPVNPKEVIDSAPQEEIVPSVNQDGIISVANAKPSLSIYSNTFSDPFYNDYYIDKNNTNLRLDEKVTALTFNPAYELKYEKNCSSAYCGLDDSLQIFKNINGQIYYDNKKIDFPKELENKNIRNISFNKLEKNWILGFVVQNDKQEEAYVYIFDGKNFTTLITSDTEQKIKTNYGYGGGSISAGGSDDQFIILYSGYEGIAYLYNKGAWQNLFPYFDLRTMEGGFKAKIIKGGDGNMANWYICADDGVKSKLVKLWQNKTDTIQGVINLSSILKNQSVKCFYKNSRELNVASKYSLQTFKDQGFDNSHAYYYQSNNINNYTGKKVLKIYFLTISINALPNSYALSVSVDKKAWENVIGQEVVVDNKNLDTAYLKIKFSAGNNEYSPWFNGLENILYKAQDRQ